MSERAFPRNERCRLLRKKTTGPGSITDLLIERAEIKPVFQQKYSEMREQAEYAVRQKSCFGKGPEILRYTFF